MTEYPAELSASTAPPFEQTSLDVKAMVDSAEDSMCAVDAQGRLVGFNEAFASRIRNRFGVVLRPGLAPEEVLLDPRLARVWLGLFGKVRAEGRVRFEYPDAGGRIQDILVNSILRDGAFAGAAAIMRDVTEQRRTEKALEESRSRIESLLESSSDEIVSIDRDLRILSFNTVFADKMVETLGRSPEVGMSMHELLPPERARLWPELFRKAEEEGRHFTEYEIPGKRILELSLNVVRQGGEVVGISSFGRDVTERRENERKLAHSRASLVALLESTEDEVWSLDPRERLETMNSSFVRMMERYTGRTPVLGMHFLELFSEELYRERWLPLRDLVDSRGRVTVEMRLPGDRIMEVTLNPVDHGKEGVGISLFARDVTERKRNETELGKLREHLEEQVEIRTRELSMARREAEAARDAAEAASRSKSTFLANMSHELRTPLNAILGFAELLSDDEGLAEEQREMAGIISSSGTHLLGIINDILDLAKVESGKLELCPEEFSPEAMLEDLLRLLRIQAESKGLGLELETVEGMPGSVHADPARLRQVVVNLVGNAIKFTEKGQVVLAASFREGPDGESGFLEVEVRDTGRGIAPEDLERIFEPFVQLDTRPGTGLGLAITRGYVACMGGFLRVESRVGVGTVFRFEVPVRVGESAAEPVEDEAPSRGERLFEGMLALVVDDIPANRRLFRAHLEKRGFTVREAVDGLRGLEACEEREPDLVLLDRRMPVMDGVQAARRLRRSFPAVRIVAVSALAFDEDRAAMLEAGCDAFLAKPVDGAALERTLRRVFGMGSTPQG